MYNPFKTFRLPQFDEKAYKAKEKEFKELEKQQMMERYLEKLKSSGLTQEDIKRAKHFKFYEFLYSSEGKTKSSKAKINAVRQWWKEGRYEYPFLILYGEKGTGKTQLAKKIAVAAFNKNMSVYYTDKKQLDLKLYQFDNLNELLENLMDVELLVIDDLLTGYQTDYKFSQIYTVLDYRYQNQKQTILTMNEDIRKFRNQEGYEHINLLSDRLNECGWFVYFDYPSLRDKAFIEAAKNGDIRPLQSKKQTKKAKEF